jgi:hypothetical protein
MNDCKHPKENIIEVEVPVPKVYGVTSLEPVMYHWYCTLCHEEVSPPSWHEKIIDDLPK